MWSREVLKNRAKAVLKISYWKAFLVSLVLAIIGGNENSSFNLNWNSGNRTSTNGYTPFPEIITNIFPFLLLITVTIIIVLFLFAVAFRILVGYPLEVGGRRFFVQSSQNNVDLNYLGYGFGNGKYLNIVTTMLWRSILTFLWTLLLIVPGIIKTYAYRMVPYILSDNPNISRTRALELSDKMTDGNKMDMWILDLSFIGWYLLGTILLFVGVLFVMPYENATKAELYLELRKDALDQGICSYEELQLKQPLNIDL
ncbi:DUF975 family protein [Clostridium bowmanii]|uniref:DUF975 family protein n=1 Tax=Clostridium bowmanii TaxID=132925 RepID=UPI001C0D8502|nr:DUF975 family protein [Clostridium bowmanii]MBU3191714.1 DUF975 family protein [Clostridium bowmanii]MCA1076027.1 DUF975 family protein [Clostridium bowmanii]